MNIREERTGDSGGLAAPLAATHQAQGRHRGGRRPRGNNSGNAEASSGECKADQMGENPKAPVKVPTPEDFKRYEGYAGQKWTGVCKWFNVSKGFGFVLPDHEQAKEHEDDVFLHQSALQMPGFRSLGEGEAIQFTVKIGKRGLEADEVTGIDGADIQGHTFDQWAERRTLKLEHPNAVNQLGVPHRKCATTASPQTIF
uniref:CSD domain-containing protein n=1 Tax=Ditylenchus dipsaci TaxID=166011 RepID=A0A915EBR4_9BILA